jgi:hypothetical protein
MMSPLVVLGVVGVVLAGLLISRRESIAVRRALDIIRQEKGGFVGGGLMTYPKLRFELAGKPAWIGPAVGEFEVDGGGSGPSTSIQIDLEGSRPRVRKASDLPPHVSDALDGLPRLRVLTDSEHLTITVGEVVIDVRHYRALIAAAEAALLD